MSVLPDLEVKKLTGADVELAASIAASLSGNADPRSECFGLSPAGPPAGGGEPWGVFLRGGLAAVLWARRAAGGGAEITGSAIPRGRWGMGLLTALAGAVADGLARSAGGGEALTVTLPETAATLAEALADAGFAGPEADKETGLHPAGEWKRGGAGAGGAT